MFGYTIFERVAVSHPSGRSEKSNALGHHTSTFSRARSAASTVPLPKFRSQLPAPNAASGFKIGMGLRLRIRFRSPFHPSDAKRGSTGLLFSRVKVRLARLLEYKTSTRVPNAHAQSVLAIQALVLKFLCYTQKRSQCFLFSRVKAWLARLDFLRAIASNNLHTYKATPTSKSIISFWSHCLSQVHVGGRVV